uniref:Glycosyl hydrolase family 13 catalytic domain-containing protein n=1 Tax=Eiseniibacteriota bacterium TaxID=2212470 RepID=A0A832I3R9_UNCEI
MIGTSLARWVRALALAALAAAALAAPAAAAKVTFRYQPVIGGVDRVAVAGSFNGWNATAHPLADADGDGVWEAVVELPKGRVEYKFVVNGDQWFTDENAAEFSPDGFGGQNAVLAVGDEAVVIGHGSTVKKAAPAQGLRQVVFKFRPSGKPDKVSLAGQFNDWTVGKTPLSDPDGDGEWSVTLLLAPGSYQYKFVVGDNGWTQDKAGQDGEADDGFGGKNSIRIVDDRFPAIDVKRGDGRVFEDGIQHAGGANEVNHMGGSRVEFTARSHRDDVDAVDLVTWEGGRERVTPMRAINADRVFEYWRADVTLPAGETPYAFRYRDGGKVLWMTAGGMSERPGERRFTFSEQKFPAFRTPDWVKDAIIYQIFPDRFRNGSTANDQDFSEWYYRGKTTRPAPGAKLNLDHQEYYHLVKDWTDYRVLTQCPWTPDGRDWMAFFGGDIEGVRQSLDYLKDLGVTAIYFNPLFEGKSTHKYDGADFRKIDPHFGTNEEFRAFVKEAKAKGIRIILDIVYNHAGNSHWAFKDAAEKGPQSPYYSWFEFKKWPLPEGWPNVGRPWKPGDYYYCWWGFGDLPDLNFDLSRNNDAEKSVRDIKDAQPNIGLITHLLDATEYWLKDMDCDGVRLDVPNEVPYWFWKLFTERVKRVKPDAYVVGELWGNASDYVRPGMYDAVMNYAFFRDPVQRFLGNAQGTAAEFDAALASGRLAYPTQAVQAQMNLIGSHDTPRFLTQVRGNVARLKLAALFGMTYVGAPHIYYGDEIAMEGERDPDCRRPFVWTWRDEPRRAETHAWYRRLAQLRHAHPALRTGEFRTVHAQGMVYGYVRSDGKEDFLVVLNAGRSEGEAVVDLAAWGGSVTATDLLGGGATETWSGTAKVKVAGESGRLFRLQRAR